MNGYIKNKSVYWRHAMKRSIGPGHEIPLDELFDQYGVKHEIKEGKPFVDWLRNVKLKDDTVWGIVYTENNIEDSKEENLVSSKEVKDNNIVKDKKGKRNKSSKNSDMASSLPSFVKKDLSPEDIANFTVREARIELKKITDIRLVKYAYELARQLSNKDSLCNMLRRHIQDLELTRR